MLSFFSAHRAVLWLRSQFQDGVYERNLAFYSLISMKDLPHKQLYIFSKVRML